jgi:N-methylhydantoinase B
LLRGEAYIAVLGDRSRKGPFGILGGEDGASTKVELSLRGERFVPRMRTKDGNILFTVGDHIAIKTPGGGGRGKPADRSRASVEEDLRRDYISEGFARAHYKAQ